MLQSTNNNPRSDSQLHRKLDDVLVTNVRAAWMKTPECFGRNQKIGRKPVRFFFLGAHILADFIVIFEEYFAFSVQQNVRRFMKEGEPQVVIRFVAQTEHDHGFGGG